MIAAATNPPGRGWARRMVPAAVLLGILGIGVAWLAFSVEKARNAARSAQTT